MGTKLCGCNKDNNAFETLDQNVFLFFFYPCFISS